MEIYQFHVRVFGVFWIFKLSTIYENLDTEYNQLSLAN